MDKGPHRAESPPAERPIEAGLTGEKLGDLGRRSERWRRWAAARRPKSIKDVVAQVIAKRGYGGRRGGEQLVQAWAQAAGPTLAGRSRAVRVNRGRLEVTVASSTVMQELTFEKRRIVERLCRLLPGAGISDLKARVGDIDS